MINLLTKLLLSGSILGFTNLTFAGHFSCKAPGYSIRGVSSDNNVLGRLVVNSVVFENLQGSHDPIQFREQRFISYSLSTSETQLTEILLSPLIDNYEDHEPFNGFLINHGSENNETTPLNCKMD